MGVNSEGRAPRLLLIITVLLLVLAALLVWLMVIPEPSAVAGLAHPDQPGMNVGGDGLARLGIAGPMLLWLQTVVLLLIHALVALGVSPARRSGGFWLLLGTTCAVSIAVWWGMYHSYVDYLHTGEPALLFGFPLPTTLAFFGVPAGSVLLCLLYVLGFRRFVYTPEDEAAYEAFRAQTGARRVAEH